jgi:hypothetical protein
MESREGEAVKRRSKMLIFLVNKIRSLSKINKSN